jgi:hypothetical protein
MAATIAVFDLGAVFVERLAFGAGASLAVLGF